MTSKKDSLQLIKQIRKQGFDCEMQNSGHWHVLVQGIRILTIAASPSDWRASRNNIARLRKFGFVWPPRK